MNQIGEKSPARSNPLEQLVACHRKIEQRLATLARVADVAGSEAPGTTEAIVNSLRFLAGPGALHTQDEEESLFPRLLPKLSEEERSYIELLESEHEQVQAVFNALQSEVKRIASGDGNISAEYRALARRLQSVYMDHIRAEEERIGSISTRLLTPEQFAEMAEEMSARRSR